LIVGSRSDDAQEPLASADGVTALAGVKVGVGLMVGSGSDNDRELLASADGATVLSLAWDSVTLLTLGADAGADAGAEPPEAEPPEAEPPGPGLECRTVVSLSPTEDGVPGVFDDEDLGLPAAESLLLSRAVEGRSGLVTPAAAADNRSTDAGGRAEPEAGEAIGLVSDVAADRGTGDTGGCEPPDPGESDDFGESFDEPGEPAPEEPEPEESEPDEPEPDEEREDESLPFRSLPILPSAFDSGFDSGFFRTTVSG